MPSLVEGVLPLAYIITKYISLNRVQDCFYHNVDNGAWRHIIVYKGVILLPMAFSVCNIPKCEIF